MTAVTEYQEPMAPKEKKRLSELESRIGKNLKTFFEVGRSLVEIHDARLYRESFLSWEQYCREKWQMSRKYAHDQMLASTVFNNLDVRNCGRLPTNESQIRPLVRRVRDDPEKQAEIWEAALEKAEEEERPMTGGLLAEVVDLYVPKPTPKRPKKRPEKSAKADPEAENVQERLRNIEIQVVWWEGNSPVSEEMDQKFDEFAAAVSKEIVGMTSDAREYLVIGLSNLRRMVENI